MNPFDMFRSASPAPKPNAGPNGGTPGPASGGTPAPNAGVNGFPAAPNPNAGAGTGGDGTNGGGTPNDGTIKDVSSPLDAFKDLFTIDPNKKPTPNPLSEKLLNLDPAALAKAVGSMNFAQHASAEDMQKALGGDVQSFQKVLNQVSQATFANVTSMFTNMMEAAFSKNNDRFNSTLGDRFKEHALNFQRPENAALNHPAAQPVLAAMKQMVSTQFPNLSPAEITKKAEDYFIAMSASITAGKTADPNLPVEKKGIEDWTKFLEMPTQ